ncbi:MAG TPA: methylated-DNA--[protein]-cysteine S-methyltransferase [Actinospica sp.]|jgi:methylated-DNA-[protein]-cysteine S-methyltransferase|nr:methylated-DNA--[protein]-cysteine S-methyltransferase [Actinospica sp.]
MSTIYTITSSPVGDYLLTGVRNASAPGGVTLTGVTLQVESEDRNKPVAKIDPEWEYAPEAFAHAAAQLQAYFSGELTDFDLELEPRGTSFQRRVWDELRKIPYGSTTTYGKITAAIGLDRSAARAVGGAVGSNPLGIIIPCHRVLGANGSLTGYADGLSTKESLLVLEGILPAPLA